MRNRGRSCFCVNDMAQGMALAADPVVGSRIICPLCQSDDLRTTRLSEHILMCVCKRCDVLFTVNVEPSPSDPVIEEPEQ
jgi:hypothetical protein